MRRLVLSAFIALGAVSAVNVTPAAAVTYPYCLQGREIGYPGDCAYTNYEQCQASASGRNASCTINPIVAFARQRGGYGNDGYAPYQPPRSNRRVYRDGYNSGRY